MKLTQSVLLITAFIFASCSGHESPQVNDQKRSNPVASQDATVKDSTEVEVIQTQEERIQDIKKWYKQITTIEKKENSSLCESAIKITYDGFNSDDEYPFENEASYCSYENGLSVRKGNFYGYEWAEYASFYYKDGVLFFAFIESGSEACFEEHRLYFDSEGQTIKYLEKVNDCDGEAPSISVEHTEDKNIKDMTGYANDKLSEIKSILAKGGK
jgi:hypothetical protein